jgi:hypothetical protein
MRRPASGTNFPAVAGVSAGAAVEVQAHGRLGSAASAESPPRSLIRLRRLWARTTSCRHLEVASWDPLVQTFLLFGRNRLTSVAPLATPKAGRQLVACGPKLPCDRADVPSLGLAVAHGGFAGSDLLGEVRKPGFGVAEPDSASCGVRGPRSSPRLSAPERSLL